MSAFFKDQCLYSCITSFLIEQKVRHPTLGSNMEIFSIRTFFHGMNGLRFIFFYFFIFFFFLSYVFMSSSVFVGMLNSLDA